VSAIEAPPRVAKVATEHDLGPFIAGVKGGNPFANAIFALVVSALLFGAMLLVGSLGLHVLRRVLVVLFAFSFLGVFFALVTLLSGFRRFFLFANGIVRWQNGRVKAVSWHDVTDIVRTRLGNIRTGYAITTADGSKLVVEAPENVDTGRLFGRQVEEVVARAGVQVWG
jgi:hypothetical protein